jgi:hypothetical protein
MRTMALAIRLRTNGASFGLLNLPFGLVLDYAAVIGFKVRVILRAVYPSISSRTFSLTLI